jgi:FtsP/CotA-like multicopper oxidase with cupredoxin domain
VIGIEDDSAAIPALRTVNAAVVNGRSWPHTERFTAHAGDTIRMRWINASDRFHPMHLHGFHFRVESRGDGVRDTVYAASDQQEVVTELMGRGGTFSMTWVPRRPGNWLMHCHMTEHFSHRLRKGGRAPDHSSHKLNHALDVMSGLVLGWQILPNGETQSTPASATTARALRLVAQPAGVKLADLAGLGFTLQEEGARGPADPVAIPGPPLVLVRGETVRVRVVNQLTERTAIHWHGIELDSYFDGVSGWSGDASRTSPHVEPGDSFDVRFTPPRAGTFIYHSHFDEERQLASGLFGPLIVLEKGERYDPRTDHSWILSQAGWTPSDPILLNASRSPMIELDADISHRVRLINISPSIPLTFQLLVDSVPVTWRALAKDGADLPASQARSQPATVQIGVGETYDFELPSSVEGELQLRVRDPVGRIRLEGTVRVTRSRR